MRPGWRGRAGLARKRSLPSAQRGSKPWDSACGTTSAVPCCVVPPLPLLEAFRHGEVCPAGSEPSDFRRPDSGAPRYNCVSDRDANPESPVSRPSFAQTRKIACTRRGRRRPSHARIAHGEPPFTETSWTVFPRARPAGLTSARSRGDVGAAAPAPGPLHPLASGAKAPRTRAPRSPPPRPEEAGKGRRKQAQWRLGAADGRGTPQVLSQSPEIRCSASVGYEASHTRFSECSPWVRVIRWPIGATDWWAVTRRA